VLGNQKWSLHLKLNLSFEMCELCVNKQENHCYIPWKERVKFLWVFKVSNWHIAYAIGAESHCANLKVKLDLIDIYFFFNHFFFCVCFFYER